MTVNLTQPEQRMLEDSRPGVALAMRLVVQLAETMRATELLPITGAHIDSCLFHGQSGLDFVAKLVDGDAQVAVPTTLNVSSLDLLHPELYRGSDQDASDAKALMDGYVALGCTPSWTCAPYQLEARPSFGEHVAWAESNAIVFANSVLGARTHRYGDFIDIAAAITGRVPNAGLHLSEKRHATMVIDVVDLSPALLASDSVFALIGFIAGRECGSSVPAIVGLPASTSEDNLKALGAAAASSGSLAMFHAVGITPEASTLDQATGGRNVGPRLTISSAQIREARDAVGFAGSDQKSLGTVSLGTPHYSVTEIGLLGSLFHGRSVHPNIDFYVSTGRNMLHEAMLRGSVRELEKSGVTFVTDTCTYITPILRDATGLAMTDSAKWAYYAPGNIGVDTIFGSVQECVESAVKGYVVRDELLWS